MNQIFKNERTMASAGTGKTFALTNRYIALVLGGAQPDEICALTFTRKAAGEFFSKTITKLAGAASSDAAAASLAKHIKEIAPALKTATRADFEHALEKFVKASPRLRLETIDAFTSKFVKFFSEELGISEGITVLDEFAESKIRARALMMAVQKFNSPRALAEFAETIRAANRGGDEKQILGAIEKFRELAHAALIETPDASKWSLPKTLGSIPRMEWDEKAYKRNCARLEEIICGYPAEEGFARKQMQYILRFFRESSPEKISTNTTKTVDQMIGIFAANGTLAGAVFGNAGSENSFKAGAEEAQIIDENLAMLFAAQVGAAQAATKAIYKIISEYESVYDEIARKKGLMSFSDMAIAISRAKDTIEREFVEYRFDSQINHWLFDEFQDTSRLQWQIFENMVSEAVLNSGGRKTFFYVGDAKQAIYAWRGGDVSLFDEILEKYRENICDNPQIKTSRRSCPAVIAAVNNIFGNSEAIKKHYGEAVAKKWAHIWQTHDVAEDKLEEQGEVTLDIIDPKNSPEGAEDGDDSQDAAVAEAVYKYIEKKNPISRKLTCAVLTQKNSLAETIIKTINARAADKQNNIRAAGELDIKIAQDNLAIPPLCAMLKAAAHPADTLSLAFAKMSPLCKIFGDAEWRENLMRKISAAGFAEALKDYAEILAAASPDKFTSLRISQFEEAARIFDMSQNRSIDDFLDFVSAYKIREGAASDTIQVMTIHKAKGLDFDMVILPQLENPKGSHIRPLHYSKDRDVFVLPGKTIRSLDANLQAAHKYTEDEESFENLCKFYVALTRAKSAIHIILPKVNIGTVKNSAGKRNFAYLLRDVFNADKAEVCEGATCSDLNNPNWLGGGKKEKEEPKAPQPEAEADAQEAKPEEPQAAENFSHGPQALPPLQKDEFSFDFINRATANLTGLAAHSIFENLNAKTTLQEAAAKAKILYADCPENFAAAMELVEHSLENPQIKEVFACADFAAELPYAIWENGEAHAGRIDRVNFFDGRKRAEIVDFKTDAATPAQLLERHSEQLRRYARALSKMSGIPPENIALKILSTHNRRLMEVRA